MLLGLSPEQFRALASGFVSMLIYGSAYTYGTLVPYMISYLYWQGDTSITFNQFAVMLLVSVTVTNLGMPFNNIPLLQFSNRTTTLISIVGISLTVLILSFGNQFWQYLLLFGFTFGLFIGYGYMAPIKNCYEHIPDRKGLCSGVCILGYGIASLLFNFIILYLVNPQNQTMIQVEKNRWMFGQQVANNLPYAIRIMSAVFLSVGLLGVFLIKPPNKKNKPLINEQVQAQQINNLPKPSLQANKVNIIAYIMQKKIHFLLLTLTFSMPFGFFIAFNYKEYGNLRISDDSFLTTVGSCGAIFNGLGRFIFGVLFDRFSFRFLVTIIGVVLLVFSLTFPLIVQIKYLYLVAVSMFYFVYGGSYSIYPTQAVRILGSKIGTKVYFLVYFGFTFACLIQYFTRSLIVSEDNKYEGFRTCFYIFAGCNAISLLITIFVKYDYQEDIRRVKNQKQ